MKKRKNSKTKLLRVEIKELRESLRILSLKFSASETLAANLMTELVSASAKARTAEADLNLERRRYQEAAGMIGHLEKMGRDALKKCSEMEGAMMQLQALAEQRGEELSRLQHRGFFERILNR